jgi:quercetin dioxygenase-like cupin family protein
MKAANILDNLEFNSKKAMISVLFESEYSKEIRVAMKSGTVMKEHKTKFPITVEIFEGSIDFGIEGKNQTLKKGDVVFLEGNIPHDLFAHEDSIIRLTLSKLDAADRVEQVSRM